MNAYIIIFFTNKLTNCKRNDFSVLIKCATLNYSEIKIRVSFFYFFIIFIIQYNLCTYTSDTKTKLAMPQQGIALSYMGEITLTSVRGCAYIRIES